MMRKSIKLAALLAALAAVPALAAIGPDGAQDRRFTAYVTGYSYWDNTPPGSTAIARPVLHQGAGGTGTYEDPITVAVGHARRNGQTYMDYPAGTRFYFPRLRKYGIVEDLCGDGDRPQDGPCHSGKDGNPWLDIYVDGARAGAKAANTCMHRLTGHQPVIINPKPIYPASAGPLTESGCRVHPYW